MEKRTGVEMRFTWSVGESPGNNGTFWDCLRTIFNLPALTGDCSCRDGGGQGRREDENGTVYHRARTSNNRFSLISLYYPLPFLCYPVSREMFDVWAVWQECSADRPLLRYSEWQFTSGPLTQNHKKKTKTNIHLCTYIFKGSFRNTQNMSDIVASQGWKPTDWSSALRVLVLWISAQLIHLHLHFPQNPELQNKK